MRTHRDWPLIGLIVWTGLDLIGVALILAMQAGWLTVSITPAWIIISILP